MHLWGIDGENSRAEAAEGRSTMHKSASDRPAGRVPISLPPFPCTKLSGHIKKWDFKDEENPKSLWIWILDVINIR